MSFWNLTSPDFEADRSLLLGNLPVTLHSLVKDVYGICWKLPACSVGWYSRLSTRVSHPWCLSRSFVKVALGLLCSWEQECGSWPWLSLSPLSFPFRVAYITDLRTKQLPFEIYVQLIFWVRFTCQVCLDVHSPNLLPQWIFRCQLAAWPCGGYSTYPSSPQHPCSQRGHACGAEGVRDLPHDQQLISSRAETRTYTFWLCCHTCYLPCHQLRQWLQIRGGR